MSTSDLSLTNRTVSPTARRAYTLAAVAILVLLAIEIADYVAMMQVMSSPPIVGPSAQNSPTAWMSLLYSAGPLVSLILWLVMAYGIVVFLSEQCEVHIPRWGWLAYVILTLAPLSANVLSSLQANVYAVQNVLGMINLAAGLIVDALLIGLFVAGVRRLRRGIEPILTALMTIIGLTTLQRILSAGVNFVMRYVLDREYTYSQAFVSAMNTFTAGYSLFHMVLMVMLLGLFVYEREPREPASTVSGPRSSEQSASI